MTSDRHYMQQALALARHGLYTSAPNPRVGCVIVRDDRIVGEGWHRWTGQAHAEANALQAAGDNARGATAYVTLEPCAHHGRTPPCADALIAAGVARVVVATEDPNPRIDGRGLTRLREAGITVETGLEADAARELNIGFFTRLEQGRPWIRVKQAMSLDGRTALANGESKWITGEAARADVQHWRARSSAIVTGVGTALADNPRLTARVDEPVAAPLRVVLDRQLRLPRDAGLLDGSTATLWLHDDNARPPDDLPDNVTAQPVPGHANGLDLAAVCAALAARDCNELQIEAGPTLSGALLQAGLLDELLVYIAPVILGDQAQPLMSLPAITDMQQRWQLALVAHQQLGADVSLRLRRPREKPGD